MKVPPRSDPDWTFGRSAVCVAFLDLKRLIHLRMDQELREKQTVPHAKDRHQKQRPWGEQYENRQVAQLQKACAQHPPENNPSSAPGIRLLFRFCFQDPL